jgi:hypothetical protein
MIIKYKKYYALCEIDYYCTLIKEEIFTKENVNTIKN